MNKLTSILLFNSFALADQPIHCLREQVYGLWEFHVSKEVNNVNLYKTNEVCSHQLINKVQLINKDHKFNFEEQDLWKVSLMDQYKVEAVKCSPECTSEVVTGSWSPIYTQLLHVQLDNGMRFISNFRYNLKEEVSPNPLEEDYHKFAAEIKKSGHDAF